jgi:hypothetical protein
MRYEKALRRLHTTPGKNGWMTKRDWIILAVMMVIYTVMAYVNLGTTQVPSTQFDIKQQGEIIRIEFEQPEDIQYIKYYAGLGTGKFYFEYSMDDVNYTRVILPSAQKTKQELEENTINHMPKDMYQWNFVKLEDTNEDGTLNSLGFTAKYIQVTVQGTQMKLNELAFCSANGIPVPIQSAVSLNSKDRANDPSKLFDEQDMVLTDHTSYMTDMYFDEVYHARTALENIEYIYPYEITHPPLGKIILGIGIRIFGMNPFGWRFMGTLFGVLLLPAMYLFAKRLFKKTLYAFIPTFLFMFDFMHFTQTRIATIDSYSVFFIILMYYFMYRYTSLNFNRDGLKKTLLPLALCGLFFGIGAATKWLCIYAGLGLAVLFFYTMRQRYVEYKAALCVLRGEFELYEGSYDQALLEQTVNTYKKNLYLTLLFCIGVFIIVPLIIYVLSYIPYLLVKDKHFGLKDIWENQKYMLNYHGNLKSDKPHPFSSPWYSWPLDIRPVFFFQGEFYPQGYIGNISSFGNPVVWLAGLASVIFIIVNRIRRKKFAPGLLFVAIAALSEYLPWILISRETFIYHYFATLPFLILLLTFSIKYFIDHFRCGKTLIYIYLAVVFMLFVLFYPVLSGITQPIWYANLIRWSPTWPFY